MMGRALLFTILAMTLIFSIISVNMSRSTSIQSDNVARYFDRIHGRNLAQAGVNLGLRRLVYDRNSRASFTRTVSGADVSVSFQDTFYGGRSAIKIAATAALQDQSSPFSFLGRDVTFTSVAYVPKASVPRNIRGAITTNNPTTTSGSMIVDGRDHDTLGVTVIAGQGVFGVWTSNTLTQTGSNKIGGTNMRSIDFAPSKPADTSIIRQNQLPYPTSPDSVLGGPANGYPEGTLKAFAQSGAGGSQYTTDPSTLTYPLRGVTYVELPAGTDWQSCNITGSGILVVHNSTRTAFMKNVNTGPFRGIILCDDISHVNAGVTMIGAVVGLTRDPSTTNDFGNGNSQILFSSDAVANALGKIKIDSVATYTNKVLAWWE
ncbi:MAG: hypothetical protein HY033_12440 [Ignavibacteriae bacterium]|nr:hypothetical protein [Ignavibacteria bacterium]MBI3365701.1 hypothetical protein [Ignavibacteriota bacterium]